MRKLTVQLQDIDGNVHEEKEITVQENEMLIMKFPEHMTLDQAHSCYRGLSAALEEGRNLIGLPDSISFEILKITS
jgi:hypothetical protein